MVLNNTKKSALCDIFDKYAVYAVSREEDKMFRNFVEKLGVRWAAGERPSELSYWVNGRVIIFTLLCTSSGKVKLRYLRRDYIYVETHNTVYNKELIPVSMFIDMVNKIVGVNNNNLIYTRKLQSIDK